jgi:uncharacterized protein YggL (DUF469 family)
MKYNPPPNRHRSRRLRKKLRIAEFQELRFPVSMEYENPLNPDEQEAFLTAFLDEVIERRDLAYGGGVDTGFVCRFGRGSVTEEDRESVSAWLLARTDVTSPSVGPLADCWPDNHEHP